MIILQKIRKFPSIPYAFIILCSMQNLLFTIYYVLQLVYICMREIITLSFGQCGIQIADNTFQLIQRQQQPSQNNYEIDKNDQVMFQQPINGKAISRSMAIDCDPYLFDQLKVGTNRHMYRASSLLCGDDSTGGVVPRGFNMANRMRDNICDQFQKIVEKCDSIQGVQLNFSTSGGAAGIVAKSLQLIKGQSYIDKIPFIANCLYPNPHKGNCVVQVYNYTYLLPQLIQFTDLIVPYDNTSLYKMLQKTFDINQAGLWQANHLIAQVQSMLTLGMRNYGPLSSNYSHLVTNMVPYPRIKMVYPSLAANLNRSNKNYIVPYNLTKQVTGNQHRLLSTNQFTQKIALGMFYRGMIQSFQIRQSLKKLVEQEHPNLRFAPWVPTGFKLTANYDRPQQYFANKNSNYGYNADQSCLCLTNSHQFYEILGNFNAKWDSLYSRRAFVYHFVNEGYQGQMFSERRQDLAALQKDYQQFGQQFQESYYESQQFV